MTGVTRVQTVQMGADGAASTTNRSKIYNAAITSGNFMVIAYSVHGTNPGNLSVSDDKANTWTRLDDGTAWDSGGGRGTAVYYALANAAAIAAAPTVTINKNGQACSCTGTLLELNCPSGVFLDCAVVCGLPNAGGTSFSVNIGPTNYDHSMVFAVGGGPEASYSAFTPTAGWTQLDSQTSTAGSIQQSIIYKDTTTSGTYTPGWTTSAADAIAIVAIVARGTTTSPTITSVSTTTPKYLGSFTVNGVNFGATQGTGGETLLGTAQTPTSWADATVAVSSVNRGTNKYNTAGNVQITINGGTTSNTYSITGILPQTGWNYVNIGTPDTTAANRITTSGGGDLATGDQVAWGNIIGTGTVTVNTDGTFVADPGVTAFDFETWTSGSGWGTTGTQTLSFGGGGGGGSGFHYIGRRPSLGRGRGVCST